MTIKEFIIIIKTFKCNLFKFFNITKNGKYMSKDGNIAYFKDGKLHRDDGPAAIIPKLGVQIWFQNGKKHREDGPAEIDDDGMQDWYLNGVKYTEEQVKVLILKEELDKTIPLKQSNKKIKI